MGILVIEPEPRLLYESGHGQKKNLVFGFSPNSQLALPALYTHFGFVAEGSVIIRYASRERSLESGDFFSVTGPATIESTGLGFISSLQDYTGFNVFGGPLDEEGKLRYIDGCTDTLLVPPVRLGDPCLNYLHFPSHITQTPHTHPSHRIGIVYRGSGVCITLNSSKPIALSKGSIFIIDPDTLHSFNTENSTMDIVVFHPDSDVGVTDDNHPMVNKTIVDGVSAKNITSIRTTS